MKRDGSHLWAPSGLAFDGHGALLVVDSGNHRIVRIGRTEGLEDLPVNLLGTGGGPSPRLEIEGRDPKETELKAPASLVVTADDRIFLADAGNHRILQVEPGGRSTVVAGGPEEGFSGDGGPAVKAQLDLPGALALDRSGNLFIADERNHRIRKITGIAPPPLVAPTRNRG